MTDIIPKISIVIPVYNGEKYLKETLYSIINQSCKSFEIICINDCSTDKSLDLLIDISSKDNRLLVVNSITNLGNAPKVIKEYGIPLVRGEYFMYMSQDDLLSNDCLEKMYNRAIQTKADAVIPDYVYYSEKKTGKKIVGLFGERDKFLTGNEAFNYSLKWEITGAALWKSKLVKLIGYYDFNMYADEYSVRMFFLNSQIVTFCDGIFYYRIDNPNAITKTINSSFFTKVYKECMILELVLKNSSDEVFQKSLESLVIMFFDYNTIKYENRISFTRSQIQEINNDLRKAFNYFKEIVKQKKVKFKIGGSVYIKYKVLKSSYFIFNLFCFLKHFFIKTVIRN